MENVEYKNRLLNNGYLRVRSLRQYKTVLVFLCGFFCCAGFYEIQGMDGQWSKALPMIPFLFAMWASHQVEGHNSGFEEVLRVYELNQDHSYGFKEYDTPHQAVQYFVKRSFLRIMFDFNP